MLRKWLCSTGNSLFAEPAFATIEIIVAAETRGKAKAMAAQELFVEFIEINAKVYTGNKKPELPKSGICEYCGVKDGDQHGPIPRVCVAEVVYDDDLGWICDECWSEIDYMTTAKTEPGSPDMLTGWAGYVARGYD